MTATCPGAGNVSGIGIVAGREVIIRADDASVKGGAWYPLTIKKMVRTLDIAIENRLPVIHICDSAGGFLPPQAELFADRYYAGRIFRNQAILSKMGVPQVALVMGHCTAGGAYIPALQRLQRDRARHRRHLPRRPAAGEGRDRRGRDRRRARRRRHAHADFGNRGLSCSERAAGDRHRARDRRSVPSRRESRDRTASIPKPPHYDPQELYGIIPRDIKVQFDMREVIARIVDGSRFHEYQPAYGTTLVCGFAHIFGYKVGILGNNGVLFNDSSLKGTHFMQLCNQNRTPMLFLQNITGYMVGREYEHRGITKDGAKMIMAVAGSEVPKITLMVNGSFGAGNYGMSGRAFDSRFLFTWPQHQISVMGAEQAANVLADIKVKQLKRAGQELGAAEIAAIREPILEEYRRQSSAYYSTSQLWDDGILDPIDTRNALGIALSATLNAPIGEPRFGVFRT